MNNYFTINTEGCDEIEIKHSRFIGYARHVESNDEAVAFIEEIRKKHRDAKHNVYAYSIREGQMKRYSDDGEPGGTAGMPVLEVILGRELTDVCVVVTRYFGGILLGTGGLVRAYTEATQLALDSAGKIEMAEYTLMTLKSDYSLYGKIQTLISSYGCLDRGTEFLDEVKLTFAVRSERADEFISEFTDATAGKISISVIGTEITG